MFINPSDGAVHADLGLTASLTQHRTRHRCKLLDAIIGLVRTDAEAKAALAIRVEFDKALGRREDGPAYPDHLDEAAGRIP